MRRRDTVRREVRTSTLRWTRMNAVTKLLTVLAAMSLACTERKKNVEHPVSPPPPIEHPAPPPEPAAPANCGQTGAPDCPLQAWMDTHLNAALSSNDLPAVAQGLREVAADAPADFADWAAWAEGGADAALRGDVAAVKRACSGCHNDYRETYRKTMRTRPVRSGH